MLLSLEVIHPLSRDEYCKIDSFQPIGYVSSSKVDFILHQKIFVDSRTAIMDFLESFRYFLNIFLSEVIPGEHSCETDETRLKDLLFLKFEIY